MFGSLDAALQAEKANEYARNQLLRNSSSELDSDASLNDLFADSPKKIKKKKGTSKARCPQPLDDDLKLNSECAVVVERIVASVLFIYFFVLLFTRITASLSNTFSAEMFYLFVIYIIRVLSDWKLMKRL